MSKCRICNRPLKRDPWKTEGIGRVCSRKEGVKIDAKNTKEDMLQIPFNGDVVCQKQDGRYLANVPHKIILHSPSGFAWGYGGSGPADLALNIMALFVGEKKAYSLHQQFKWDMIATMAPEGGVIPYKAIVDWLKLRGVREEEIILKKKEDKSCLQGA